jgi:hypothetical protein
MEQVQNNTATKSVKANVIVLAITIASLIIVAIAKNMAA